jgi:uncharacterized lipoprotein YddW (UPF0748 family)
MRPLVRIAVLAVALMAALLPTATPAAAPQREYAVSLDPADYLSTVRDASVLSKNLVAKLAANGVNTIYLNAYNVEYGAYYRTSYRYNSESDYGRQDLLGKLLTAAHARGIEVFASFYDHQHRGAWEAQPGWREQTATGGYYNPPGTDVQYYLSPGNPQPGGAASCAICCTAIQTWTASNSGSRSSTGGGRAPTTTRRRPRPSRRRIPGRRSAA